MLLNSTFVVAVVLSVLLGIAESQPCGPSGKQCIVGQATCDGTQCVCNNPPYTQGQGNFACYQANRAFAELRNDPKLINFNTEKVDFPYPCRYLFTHVEQQLKDKDKVVIGKCEYMIHAYNAKHRGKFYNKGYDIALRISYNSGTIVELSARKYGWALNGANQFTQLGTFGAYLPNGDWGNDVVEYNDPVNGVKVEHFEDVPNNQLVLNSRACGLRITFAPYDYILTRDQPRIPGLSVAIHCAHHPKFLSGDAVMALGRADFPGGQTLSEIILPGLNERESVLARAFKTLIEQNQPDANPECAIGHEILFGCNGPALTDAFNNCLWMLLEPRFIRCVDDSENGETITSLFNDCVASYCIGGPTCHQAVNFVQAVNCDAVPNIDDLPSFNAGNRCP